MKRLRHAVVLAALVLAPGGLASAERTGPEASEMIYPRASAPAAAGEQPGNTGAFAPGAMPGGLGRALGYTLALGVLVGGAWMLLKRGALPRPFAKGGGRLQVLESRMLGHRQFLMVVEYEEARMLIGVGPGRIDYLTPLAGHPLSGASSHEDDASERLVPAGQGGAQ